MNNMTWHFEIILQNDQDCACAVDCLATHVMNKIYHRYDGRTYEDQRGARIYVLSQFLRAYVEELIDAGNEHGDHNPMLQELILGALQEINFREIAETLIGDYSPKSAEEVAEDEEFFNIMGFGNYDIDED